MQAYNVMAQRGAHIRHETVRNERMEMMKAKRAARSGVGISEIYGYEDDVSLKKAITLIYRVCCRRFAEWRRFEADTSSRSKKRLLESGFFEPCFSSEKIAEEPTRGKGRLEVSASAPVGWLLLFAQNQGYGCWPIFSRKYSVNFSDVSTKYLLLRNSEKDILPVCNVTMINIF